MRIFLRLGDSQLLQVPAGDEFAEAVGDRLRRERDAEVPELVAVARQAHELRKPRKARSGKAVECAIRQRARHLPRAVGAKVHEHDDVAVAHLRRTVCAGDHGRPDELIRFAACVGGLERRFRRRSREWSDAVDEELVSGRHALPALVAVHGVVAAADRIPY